MEYVKEMTIEELYRAGVGAKDRAFEIAAQHKTLAGAAILAPIAINLASYALSGTAYADNGYYTCTMCPSDDPSCVSRCSGPNGEYWDGKIHVYDNPVEMYADQFGEWLENHPEGSLAIIAASFGVGQLIKGLINRQKE
jgi:hypothetical protein